MFCWTYNVTTFPDEEISFFRKRGITTILIIAHQNLVFNPIMNNKLYVWLVVLDSTALFTVFQSISRQKRGKVDEKKISKQPYPHFLQAQVGRCPSIIQISRAPRHRKFSTTVARPEHHNSLKEIY